MKFTTIIWIAAGWLLLNAIFPLVLNALERLYQHQIDVLIRLLVRSTKFLILAVLQLVLIVIYAPNILLIGILERIYPRLFEFRIIKKTGFYEAMHVVISKEFWPTVAATIREMREGKRGVMTDQETNRKRLY